MLFSYPFGLRADLKKDSAYPHMRRLTHAEDRNTAASASSAAGIAQRVFFILAAPK